jgi:hypothetical protein
LKRLSHYPTSYAIHQTLSSTSYREVFDHTMQPFDESQPKGHKKTIIGKGEWLKLAGISTSRAAVYRAIAGGETTLKEQRSMDAARKQDQRANPKVPGHPGQNGQPKAQPAARQPDHAKMLAHTPDPKGTASAVSFFVGCVSNDAPEAVLPHLEGVASVEESSVEASPLGATQIVSIREIQAEIQASK